MSLLLAAGSATLRPHLWLWGVMTHESLWYRTNACRPQIQKSDMASSRKLAFSHQPRISDLYLFWHFATFCWYYLFANVHFFSSDMFAGKLAKYLLTWNVLVKQFFSLFSCSCVQSTYWEWGTQNLIQCFSLTIKRWNGCVNNARSVIAAQDYLLLNTNKILGLKYWH